MIDTSTLTAAIRYVDNFQMQRDLERQRQAELAMKKGASHFLTQGLETPKSVLPVEPITPLIVPKLEVARLSAQKLSLVAARAAAEIARELKPYGLKVTGGDRVVLRPMANKHLVHLCETMVCHIPYSTKWGKGRLIVRMTNFASGVAVPSTDGIHYRDVTPLQDAAMERTMFRVFGVHTDLEGHVVGIDPRFIAKGIAWNVDSVYTIIDACKRRVMR